MDPPGPSAKRRRSEEQAAGEPPPQATEATEAANPRPQPDARGEDGGGVDRISSLPDAILGEIISLLPTKEAARTQTLASRWRLVWRAAPLVLDSTDLFVNGLTDDALASTVSHILSTHPGPGRRFCVLPHHLHDRAATVDAWLRSPALDNLQELDFWCDGIGMHRHHRQFRLARLPAATFRFSATLCVATFSECELPDSSIEGLHFPHLTQLALERVSISEGSLHTMICICPVLECLLLGCNIGFSCVRITSSSLRSFGVDESCHALEEISIVDAPCLERLLFLQQLPMRMSVSVISAPKLEILGCIGDVYDDAGLMIGDTVFQGPQIITLTTVVHGVKTLAVNSWCIDFDIEMVVELMKCFPCLEKLYIKAGVSGDMNRWCRKHKQFTKSFDIHLKTIVLEDYRGIKSHADFVSFFLLNARELELMTLVVKNGADNEAFFAKQHKMLQMEKRASRGARLHFTTHSCKHGIHVNHVRDLAITDPFEYSSQKCSLGASIHGNPWECILVVRPPRLKGINLVFMSINFYV